MLEIVFAGLGKGQDKQMVKKVTSLSTCGAGDNCQFQVQLRVTDASKPVNVVADGFAGGRSFPYCECLAIDTMARFRCSGSDSEA